MIEVTKEAITKVMQFLDEQEKVQPIRILTAEGGWRGPYLVMALDEKKENDLVFTDSGVSFLIDKELLDRAKYVKIDYVHSPLGSGYTLNSDLLKDIAGDCELPVCHTCCPQG